mmetsp:Transcript_23980/g.71924  ORF Transcript_23980/g.71924 Transcript_23980/m.71924 type:complete len:596 (+) Transcript_23980:17-1804(+)
MENQRGSCRADAAVVELVHVEPPVEVYPDCYFFDEAHQHLVVRQNATLQAVRIRPSAEFASKIPTRGVLVGPEACQLAKFSLDGSLLAVQLSDVLVLVAESDGTQRWRIEIRSGAVMPVQVAQGFLERMTAASGNLDGKRCTLIPGGIVWTDHGGTSQDLTLVTTRGAELYKVSCARGQCKAVRSLTYTTRYFWYAAPARLLVLGTGMSGGDLRPYWLRYQVSDLPKFELPPPEKVRKLELAGAQQVDTAILDPRDVEIACCYGRAYILYRLPPDNVDIFIVLKDRCEPLRRLRLGATGPWFTTTDDNLLLIHIINAHLSFVVDLDGLGGHQPMTVAQSAATGVQSDECCINDRTDRFYDGTWPILSPSTCLRVENGFTYEIRCNLAALAKQNMCPSTCTACLLRRNMLTMKARVNCSLADLVTTVCTELLYSGCTRKLRDVLHTIAIVNERHATDSLNLLQATVIRHEAPRRSDRVATVEQRSLLCIFLNARLSIRSSSDGLIIYLGALCRSFVPVDAALSVAVIHALAALGEYGEILQLFQYKTLQDSPPVVDAAFKAAMGIEPCSTALQTFAHDMLYRLRGGYLEKLDDSGR